MSNDPGIVYGVACDVFRASLDLTVRGLVPDHPYMLTLEHSADGAAFDEIDGSVRELVSSPSGECVYPGKLPGASRRCVRVRAAIVEIEVESDERQAAA